MVDARTMVYRASSHTHISGTSVINHQVYAIMRKSKTRGYRVSSYLLGQSQTFTQPLSGRLPLTGPIMIQANKFHDPSASRARPSESQPSPADDS